MEHLEENLQYATDDLNAFNAMEHLKHETQSDEETNTYTEKELPIDLIKEKIEQIKVMATECHLFVSHTSKAIAEWRIRLGAAFNELKFLLKRSDESWEEWANENLPFVGKRNRQKCMLLARRVDCHRHTDLGVDRLEMLCSATKDSDAEDPIGTFMSMYGITVDETADVDLEEFKLQVDVALNRQKLERRHIQVSPEVVETKTRQGKSFDKALLKKLANTQREGGDPEASLGDPSSIRKEKEEAEPPVQEECEPPAEEEESEPTVEEESEPPVEDMAEDFKARAAEMIRMVDEILECPGTISKIEPDYITELIEKLIELQTAANTATEEAEAA